MATLPADRRRRWTVALSGLTALAAVVSLAALPRVLGAGSQEEPAQDDRTVLMRRKLDHAQRILGGLAEGRAARVARSARALHEISEVAALYNLPTDDYRRFSAEFRRITLSLAERAEADDLDAATLSNVQLTINCVDCHKYVRIQQKPPDPPSR